MIEPEEGFERLIQVLNRLEIPFMAGGSLASSIHGVFRSTNDIDLVVDMRPEQAASLIGELSSEFYGDQETIDQALASGRPFNLIHYASTYKFDLFPLGTDPYYQTQFHRRRMHEMPFGGGLSLQFPVATPEDIILAKLVWYRRGGEASDRQWSDLRGVHAMQAESLDLDYLRKWASHLQVAELLDRLLEM